MTNELRIEIVFLGSKVHMCCIPVSFDRKVSLINGIISKLYRYFSDRDRNATSDAEAIVSKPVRKF
jgi:hypothetical protein